MVISARTMRLFNQMLDHGILTKPDISVQPPPQIRMPNTGAQDFAAYMLTHTSGNRNVAKSLSKSLASREDAESAKASVLSSLLDTLSVPLYTATNIVKGTGEKGADLLGDIGIHTGGAYQQKPQGFGKDLLDLVLNQPEAVLKAPGTMYKIGNESKFANPMTELGSHLPSNEKITGQNILSEDFGVKNKAARFGGGLALDFAMDPLSYVGVGIGKNALKGVQGVLDAKAALPAERITGEMAAKNVADFRQAKQVGLARPEFQMPNTTDMALTGGVQNQIGNLGRVKTPTLKIPDELRAKLDQFTPRTRMLQRRWAQQEQKLATDVERGLVDIPNPARNAAQKMQRAQNDWERAMIHSGQVADKTGRVSSRAAQLSATQMVKNIVEGKTPRYVAQAPRVADQGLATESRDIADTLIDKLMGPKRINGRFAKRNTIKEVTPGQQIALFHNVLRSANVGDDSYDLARSMLATAEDHLIALGVQPIDHNGIRVRLSDLMETLKDEVPPTEILNNFAMRDPAKMNPKVRVAMQGLAAQRTVAASEITSQISKLAVQAKDKILDFSPYDRPVKEQEVMDTSIEAAMQRGMTAKEIDAVKDLVRNIIDVDKLPADKWVLASANALHEAADKGIVDKSLILKFNQAVADGVGVSYKDLGTKITGNRAIDTIMTHMTTWWGRGEWRHVAQDVFDAGEENAVQRAKLMRYVVKSYSPDEIRAAWNHASNKMLTDDPRAQGLSNMITSYMRQVFKVRDDGLNKVNETLRETSVAERSQTMMEDVNKHLKEVNGEKSFQFTRSARVRDELTQQPRDYSAPGDWAKSWELADPSDPVAFLYNLDLAMERTTREYAFVDDFAGRYGSLKPSATHDYAIPLSRIKGFYVPEDIGRQFMRVMKDMEKGPWRPHTPITRFHSKALRIWKTGVTIYLPSHHIRNAIGDTYLMWLAGHNDPRSFIWARRVMASQRTKYKEAIKRGNWDTLEELTSPDAINWANTRGGDVIINRNGIRLTADQIYVHAHQRGLLKDAYAYEDIFGEAPLGGVNETNAGFKKLATEPFGGHVHDVATTAAEYREHYIRLAHFMSAIDKGLRKNRNLGQVIESAAAEVRKWHPDGRDLTYFEQKTLRNIAPFYSWVRKSTPLLIQGFVQRPAKQLAYPRGMLAMSQALGVNAPDATLGDPYPDDQLFPEWIRAYGVSPIGDPQSTNMIAKWWGNLARTMIDPVTGENTGYAMVNPSNPMIDAGQQFLGFGPKDTAAGVFDSVNPFAKVPIEIATNRDFTGAPITKDEGGQGLLHYLSKQVPMTAPFQRVTDIGDKPRPGVENTAIDNEALINILTAMGLRGTGPYIKSAEFEKKAARQK